VKPFFADDAVSLYHGDALAVLRELPAESVDCVVTSPPYYGLRDYGEPGLFSVTGSGTTARTSSGTSGTGTNFSWLHTAIDVSGLSALVAIASPRREVGPKEVGQWCPSMPLVSKEVGTLVPTQVRTNTGQYGLEATPAEYVETMRAVFAEAHRVLAKDGTLWLNLGDTYASKANGGASVGRSRRADRAELIPARANTTASAPYKSLLGIPWRVAFALIDGDWILRSDIIWSKTNILPESVTDRPTRSHEYLFLFTKSPRYWYDADAIRDASDPEQEAHNRRYAKTYEAHTARVVAGNGQPGNVNNVGLHARVGPGGRNARSVWTVSTQPFPQAHFAVMAPALAERCILAGCRPGGVVLDPFMGSGTTGMVAGRLGRRFVGVDLSEKYLRLALRTRLAQTTVIDSIEAPA
jgi:DNA modification methylase